MHELEAIKTETLQVPVGGFPRGTRLYSGRALANKLIVHVAIFITYQLAFAFEAQLTLNINIVLISVGA